MSDPGSVHLRHHVRDQFRFESRTVAGPPGGDPPVLLIGGAFQRKESWGRIEEYLLRRRGVVTIDLPGWGAADTLPARYGTDFLVEALYQALTELGVTAVDVAGGSYGAMIGYRLAQLHPELVEHLLVMACLTTIPEPVRRAVDESLTLLTQGQLDEFAAATVALFMCRDRSRTIVHRTAIERILTRRFAAITADEAEKYVENTRRLLGRDHLDPTPPMRRPLLVVTGEHDTYTPADIGRRVAATAPAGILALMADADHMNHLERPQETVELLLTFFDDQPVEDLPFCRVVERLGPGAPAPLPA